MSDNLHRYYHNWNINLMALKQATNTFALNLFKISYNITIKIRGKYLNKWSLFMSKDARRKQNECAKYEFDRAS